MVFKRKKYNYFLLLVLVCTFIFIVTNNALWINAFSDEPLKRNLLTLGRAITTIGLFVIIFFIFRMFNRSVTITENEIIENKFIGKNKIIPIDELVQITISSTNDVTKKMYYSPKARKRYKLLTKLDSVLFSENSNQQPLWKDILYQSKEELEAYLDTCTHLTEEEKQQIRYQKEYEQQYIQYEESIRNSINRPMVTVTGNIPNKLRQAKIIANELKSLKNKYNQANEQNSQLGANHNMAQPLLTQHTIRPVITMKTPYLINNADALTLTLVTTGEINSLTINLEEFHNPVALYSSLYSLGTTSNRIRLDISDIANNFSYIPSSYRGELKHD